MEKDNAISINSSELSIIIKVMSDHCKDLPSTWQAWGKSINQALNSAIERSSNKEDFDVSFALSKENWLEVVRILESSESNYDENSKLTIKRMIVKISNYFHIPILEENEIAATQPTKENDSVITSSDVNLLSKNGKEKTVLWSGLIKSFWRVGIFCPPELIVVEDDFYKELQDQISTNRIPATAELCNIDWDNTGISQKRIIVTYSGDEIKPDENVIQFLIGVDDFGNFSYIEEKVIIKKPDLPPYPQEKEHSERPSGSCGLYFILFILGIIPGLIYRAIISGKQEDYDAIVAKDEKLYKKQKKEWDNAWDTWENNVFRVAYLSATNDIYGRFTETISIIVKNVIKVLYEDRKAEIRERTEQEYTKEQLKDEMEKRRKEFK